MQQTQYIAAWKSGVAARWRGLSWSEYRTYSQRLQYDSPIEVYIDLYRALVIEGPDIEVAPAGIVEFIGRTMMETNPFGGRYEDIRHALHVKRANQTYLDTARALVAGIFRYTFEEIDTWDADTFFDRVAKAEFLAGKPLEPEDPHAAEKQKQQQKNPNQPPRRSKKPLTTAQQMVIDRRNNQR